MLDRPLNNRETVLPDKIRRAMFLDESIPCHLVFPKLLVPRDRTPDHPLPGVPADRASNRSSKIAISGRRSIRSDESRTMTDSPSAAQHRGPTHPTEDAPATSTVHARLDIPWPP